MFMKWLTASSSTPDAKWLRGFVLFVSLLVLSSCAGCSLLPKEQQEEVLPTIHPPKLAQKPVYTVKTDTLESKVRLVGKLMSTQEETLYFTGSSSDSSSSTATGGQYRVKAVDAKTGQKVKKGDLIAEIDVTDLERQYKLDSLSFRKDHEIPLIQAMRDPNTDPVELENLKIDFQLAQTKLQDEADEINNAKITAPFDGTVVSVMVQKGDQVQEYDPVAIVSDLNQLVVAASAGADDLEKVAVGMEADVDINGAGSFKGKVQQLPVPQTDNNNNNNNIYNPYGNSGTRQQQDSIENYLLVELNPFPKNMNRGTPLSVTVITDRKENAIVIPSAALRTHAGQSYVEVQDDDGTKREVNVEVGQQTATEVEIVKGLTPGQKVVGN